MANKNDLKAKSQYLSHTCQAIVVTCIDFRLRKYLRSFLTSTLDEVGYDRVAIAGGVKNLPFIVDQIELSHKLHEIKEVYLINHEDCGAYGEAGNFQKHKEDLQFAGEILKRKLPHLKVNLFYLKLNGEFVKV